MHCFVLLAVGMLLLAIVHARTPPRSSSPYSKDHSHASSQARVLLSVTELLSVPAAGEAFASSRHTLSVTGKPLSTGASLGALRLTGFGSRKPTGLSTHDKHELKLTPQATVPITTRLSSSGPSAAATAQPLRPTADEDGLTASSSTLARPDSGAVQPGGQQVQGRPAGLEACLHRASVAIVTAAASDPSMLQFLATPVGPQLVAQKICDSCCVEVSGTKMMSLSPCLCRTTH